MNPKTTIGLVIALLVGLVAVWWAESADRAKADKAPSGPKALIDPPMEEPVEFEWVAAGSPAIKCVLREEKWHMTAPIDGPTEHYVVNSDVTRLKDLKYIHAYPSGDADRPTADMAGLATPGRSVKLVDKKGRSVVLRIGARQSLSSKTYVQKEGDETIYLVDADLNQELKKGLSDYRGKRMCEFTATDAVKLEATGEQHYVFTGNGGSWTLDAPIKARADRAAVTNVVRAISSLSATAFVADAPKSLRPYGLETPRLVVSVHTEKKTPKPPPAPPASAPAEPEYDVTTAHYKIAFGGIADEKVFAKLLEPASDAVFQVSESTFKQIAVPLDDLRDKAVLEVDAGRAQKLLVRSGVESVELMKEGGRWKITAGLMPGEHADAEPAAVEDLLRALRELKATGFESTELPSHGFKSPRSVIEVTSEGRVEPSRLTVGGLTSSKTGAYVRNEGDGTIAVVKAESVESLVVRPIEFLSRELIRFQRDMVSRLDLAFPKYTLTASKSGALWKIIAPVDGNAHPDAVNALLTDLSMLRGRRVVGRAKDAKTYGLESPTVKATVTVENPPIAKPPPAPPASAPTEPEMEPQPPTVYTVRLTKMGDKAYALREPGNVICEIDVKVVDDALAEMLETRVVSMESSQITRLTYGGAEAFALEKSGETWKLAGEPTFKVDAGKVIEVLTALSQLRAKEYARYAGAKPDEYGLKHPAWSIAVQDEQGRETKLLLSDRGPEKGGRYGCLSDKTDRVFVLHPEDVDKLRKRVVDFEQK
jgi:hypothetical protein